MPTSQKKLSIFLDQPLDLQNLSATESSADLQANRTQPKLRRLVFALNMDVWRLIPVTSIEKEPIRPCS
jgi:hypothetical protein